VMQAHSSRRIKTFSIGFEDPTYDEAQHAQAVARHLGTDHTQVYMTDRDAREVIPNLPSIFDEPFADSSQIPTYLVARLARKQVTVSLSGDGGDELFCGYPRYLLFRKLWRRVAFVPRLLRQSGGRAVYPLLVRTNARRLCRTARLLADGSPEALYQELVSAWKSPEDIVLGGAEQTTAFTNPPSGGRLCEPLRRMMYIDLMSYLPDDILVKVDRATMAVCLESRSPLLDHQLVEFALQRPHNQLVRNGETKWILRQVLDRYVPRALVERPKMGFGVPLAKWLRQPLRQWANERLEKRRLLDEGFFYAAPVHEKWDQHCRGEQDWSAYLWRILMFQEWYEAC
ncbi:MAG: asparagine synthetase B family protein, partial [Candidatus Binatia bacterium]